MADWINPQPCRDNGVDEGLHATVLYEHRLGWFRCAFIGDLDHLVAVNDQANGLAKVGIAPGRYFSIEPQPAGAWIGPGIWQFVFPGDDVGILGLDSLEGT